MKPALSVLALKQEKLEDQRLLEDIFRRYLKNECTGPEIKFLLEHFRVGTNEDLLRSAIAKRLNAYPLEDVAQLPQANRSLDGVFERILDKIEEKEIIQQQEDGEKKSSRPFILRLFAAVTLALIIFESIYSYRKAIVSQPVAVLKHKSREAKITPGSNKAVLTLQDGSTIVLDDAENGTVARQSGATIVKMASGQLVYNGAANETQKVMFNTMSTPRGGQYKLTLPDGTAVWLNSASSITYPTAFVGNERNVSITGEAYFEVAKDKTKPFHVKAGKQTIEVLGTHFNVMAYADEDVVKTTLVEGAVKISQNSNSGILRPGEQAVNKSGEIEIGPAAIDEALAWKNGYFKFNRVGIKPIMRQLSRWYDVEVVYEGSVKNDEFVGTFSRAENITQALHLLELTSVHFKIMDKKIIVLPY